MAFANNFRTSSWSLLAALVSALLAGCAGIPNETAFRSKVSAWSGHEVSELIDSWGPPDSTLKDPDGTVVYTYYEGEIVPTACTVDFMVDHARKIVGWRFAGTACRTTYG
jgi:hypothetical protein